MSTTPLPPSTPIQRAESWLKQHERIVIVLVLGLTLWFGIGKIDTLIQNHDNANLQQAKIVAQVQQEKNDALAKQIAQDKADYTALSAQVQARDAQLVQLQDTLVTALARQQKVDATLPPTELVARWNKLVPQAGATVTPSGVALPSAGAIATVVALERAPELDKQLAASGEELANANKLVASEGTQITDLTTSVAGLHAKAIDDGKVCDERVKTVKDDVRKSKRHWFYAGMVVGFIGRQIIKTYTGL